MAWITQTVLVLACSTLALAIPAVTGGEGKAPVQIMVDNLRNATIVVHCCSGGNDLCQRTVDPLRYYPPFVFTPSIIGNTVFNCRASYAVVIDPNIPTIKTVHQTWPAYKESPGNPQGNAIFAIHDDGIYWDGSHWLNWQETTTFPPALPPTCSQFPAPCQA